jgi:hypothetical protein
MVYHRIDIVVGMEHGGYNQVVWPVGTPLNKMSRTALSWNIQETIERMMKTEAVHNDPRAFNMADMPIKRVGVGQSV